MTIWKIDPPHSDVEFKIRHLMITNVSGYFGKYDVTVESNKDDFSDAKIIFEADVASISTKNEQRDKHLQTADFFNADKFPKIRFISTFIKNIDGKKHLITGDLTIRDITKPIVLDVEYNGIVEDPYGKIKAGFEITGRFNRKEFGVSFSGVADNGLVVLGDEVKLQASIQLAKQV